MNILERLSSEKEDTLPFGQFLPELSSENVFLVISGFIDDILILEVNKYCITVTDPKLIRFDFISFGSILTVNQCPC